MRPTNHRTPGTKQLDLEISEGFTERKFKPCLPQPSNGNHVFNVLINFAPQMSQLGPELEPFLILTLASQVYLLLLLRFEQHFNGSYRQASPPSPTPTHVGLSYTNGSKF